MDLTTEQLKSQLQLPPIDLLKAQTLVRVSFALAPRCNMCVSRTKDVSLLQFKQTDCFRNSTRSRPTKKPFDLGLFRTQLLRRRHIPLRCIISALCRYAVYSLSTELT